MKTLKRSCVLAVALSALLCVTACGKLEGYEIKKVAEQCGGVDKVHSVWKDSSLTKGYCIDGSKSGDW